MVRKFSTTRLALPPFPWLVLALFLLFLVPSTSQARNAATAYPNFKIAVIMLTFSDNPAKPNVYGTATPLTKAYAQGELFDNANSMAAFYNELSNGQVTVSGDVYDNAGQWYDTSRPSPTVDDCDLTSYYTRAMAAADADIDYTQYNTVMLITPWHGCTTGGLAASMPVPDNGATYGFIDVSGAFEKIPHHELGHLIGWGHANSWQCTAPGVLTGSNCAAVEYADRFSVMGVSPRMLIPAAPHLEAQGWLEPTEITTVSADGDYTIQAYESANALPKVLKIPQARDASGNITNWYYLEYRQPVSYDNIARTPTIQELGVPNGALVHWAAVSNPDVTTTLLDMTPGTLGRQDIFDPALPLGYSYTDAAAGVGFGVLARTATTMTIRVKFSTASLCILKAPTVTIKSVKGAGKPGQELRYDVTVKNNSVLCGKQSVELLTRKAPTGWKVTIDRKKASTVIVTSGQTQKYIVRLTSPKKSKYQKYTFNLETRLAKKPSYKKAFTLKPVIR
jgi:hypothetical protein